MTGRARRQTAQLLREIQARAAAPVLHTADLPAIAEHPACPPLDIDALTAPIVLSPNLAAPAVSPPPPRESPPRREPQLPSAPRVPDAQIPVVVEVATRLMVALVGRYGRQALTRSDVRESVSVAVALVREVSQ